MKHQVNIWIPQDIYKELVKMAAERQLEEGKEIRISRLAADLVIDVVEHRRNGNRAQESDKVKEAKQDDKQEMPADYFADLKI